MDQFLDKVFLSNTVKDWLITAGIILVVLILNKFISRYVAQFVCKLFKRNWKTLDQHKLVALIIYPLSVFLTVTIEGAKDYIKKSKKVDERYQMIQSLQRLKVFLLELKAHL